MTMQTPDILILGGGVIGCSLALELARAGQRVTVVERGRAGSGASSAAAGLLTPTLAASPAGALVELCRQSALLYEGWLEQLRADGAADVGFCRDGLLEVCLPAQAEAVQAGLAVLHRPERRAEWLSSDELRRREPALSTQAVGAAWYPDDAQVDPARLTQQVARVAELAGVQILESEPVRSMRREGERIAAVHTANAVIHPGLVVVAAGAWSGPLLELLGIALPTRPVKGQMLLAGGRVAPVRTPLFVGDALFVPRSDGRLTLGVTIEEVGFDERVTLDGIHTILKRAVEVVPAVRNLDWVRAWAGLRPATPDGWPYMGPVAPFRNLWASTGHYRKGILLAPICARLLAQSILGGQVAEELTPFKPTRTLPK